MLKITIKNDVSDVKPIPHYVKPIPYYDIIDVVFYPDGDVHTKTYLSMSKRLNGRIEYVNIYSKPFSVRIETDE